MKHAPVEAPEHSQFGLVVELLGEAAGLALSEHLGGRRIYVPRRPGAAHPLSVVLGREGAAVVGERMAGEHLDVPLSAGRRTRIVKLAESGLSREEIRRRVGCSRRTVYLALAEAKKRPGARGAPKAQLDLL